MKKLFIILFLLIPLILNAESIFSKLKKLKMRLSKDYKAEYQVTAVAGVRGDDVSNISKSPIAPTDLIWEE